MAVKSEVKSTTLKGTATKISRKVVEMIHELVEVRAIRTEANDKAEELRQAIFAEVGEVAQTLTHHNIDVASITRTEKSLVDVKKLQTEFPEVYELVKRPSESFAINAVAKRKSK
jgi:predicted phage-related endonuclease